MRNAKYLGTRAPSHSRNRKHGHTGDGMKNDIQELKRTVDALVRLMAEWADWQKGYRMKLGYPSRSCGLSTDAATTFEDMCDAVDGETMRIVDGVVQEDLTPIERAAVLRRYGVAAVFRFPRDNYADVLGRAHERLFVLLRKKGVVIL